MRTERLVGIIISQAQELLKSEEVERIINNCKTEEEKSEKLLIASVYALLKENVC